MSDTEYWSRDYCRLSAHGHTFLNWTYWGYKHPKCNCGFEDRTRVLR